MIARFWHGRVPQEKSDRYAEYMRAVVLPDYRGVPGNRGAWCMRRDDGEIVHFELLSFWDDVEAVKLFAGEDHEIARYYDFDDLYLIEKEPGVLHYEVCAGTGV
ncbi:antibiotic biosynthesis monooxygenase [Caulobacter sp. 17J65-9]|uniref:antibiotic biosynthesis monooxygenase n=1 Tax=Caulobacter sp. 17J65-9 TaxID=2709382 RepID=UPI0013C7C330|nr:antibiotic biosynthesis monooxygenase [Caulobacter sp. 17J65-9]NEX92122.1 antibiotic biosynthesis monooxygenase [Caulobacter sp. 17J65-9]